MNAQARTASWLDEPQPLPRRRPRILVADDDPYLVRVFKEDLELEGYEVACAYDGMHALHQAYTGRFDLIILDINMPITNGYRVLENLRMRPETANIPVIVVTAETSQDVYPRVARDPKASYLKKPLELDNLNSLIRHYLKN